MTATPEEIASYRDLFSGLGEITTRPMMGGTVFYADGKLFATHHGEGRLYLRTKGGLAKRLETEGAHQLTWTRPTDGKVQSMGYWSLPDAALDDPALACDLARDALKES